MLARVFLVIIYVLMAVLVLQFLYHTLQDSDNYSPAPPSAPSKPRAAARASDVRSAPATAAEKPTATSYFESAAGAHPPEDASPK
jgi:hypothetical protein